MRTEKRYWVHPWTRGVVLDRAPGVDPYAESTAQEDEIRELVDRFAESAGVLPQPAIDKVAEWRRERAERAKAREADGEEAEGGDDQEEAADE